MGRAAASTAKINVFNLFLLLVQRVHMRGTNVSPNRARLTLATGPQQCQCTLVG
jgi:hypothetical protein